MPLVPRSDVPGLRNFAEVSPLLWRGAQPSAAGCAELRRLGIKTIVNLRSFHSDRNELSGLGLRHVHLRCLAWRPKEEAVLTFLRLVREARFQPLFVHCQHGADRTGCMVAAYRIVEQGWSAADAIDEIRSFGHHTIFRKVIPFVREIDVDAIAKKLAKVALPKAEVVR